MTNALPVLLSGLFGLILGSFINVVALRDEKRKSIIAGRSKCPHCKHVLAWYDLVPLLSYLSTMGKCRYCKKTISVRYPVVELVTACIVAVVWMLGTQVYGNIITAICLVLCALLLIVVSLIDLQSFAVPVEYVVAAGAAGFVGMLASGTIPFIDLVRGLAVGAGTLAVILYGWKAAFNQDGMGSGDLWIAGAMGATLGYPLILPALMSAVLSGAVLGSLLAVFSKKGLQSAIPFGPFLSAGWLMALLWGQSVIDWYILGL